jgi:hypothetical protein
MKKHLSKLLFLIIGLSLAATVSYLNAWTGPTQTAPEGNVSAPLNIGSALQFKNGSLSLGTTTLPTVGYTLDVDGKGVFSEAVASANFCLGVDCISSWSSVGGGSSVPAGTVAAFNLTTCPSGWIPADGTSGTVDLRGYFIRGYGTNTDGTVSGAFGVTQADAFKAHTHSIASMRTYGLPSVGGSHNFYAKDSGTVTTSSVGDNTETRPKNVALLFCQKDGTSAGGGSVSSDEFSTFKSTNNISNFPNNIVCTSSGVQWIYKISAFYGSASASPNSITYWYVNSLVRYNLTGGVTEQPAGGGCPTQLSLDGRLTQ